MTIASPSFSDLSSGASAARPLLDERRWLLRLAAPIMFICLVNMG
jgi:hypothetical protein